MKPSFVSTTQRHSGLLQRSLITRTPVVGVDSQILVVGIQNPQRENPTVKVYITKVKPQHSVAVSMRWFMFLLWKSINIVYYFQIITYAID